MEEGGLGWGLTRQRAGRGARAAGAHDDSDRERGPQRLRGPPHPHRARIYAYTTRTTHTRLILNVRARTHARIHLRVRARMHLIISVMRAHALLWYAIFACTHTHLILSESARSRAHARTPARVHVRAHARARGGVVAYLTRQDGPCRLLRQPGLAGSLTVSPLVHCQSFLRA